MQIVSAETVHRLADYPALIEALAAAHRGPMPALDRALLQQGEAEPKDAFLVLPAWLPGEAFGVKVVTVLPANEADRGLPSVHGQYLLFDGVDGRPTALIDGTALTLRKTAADSALGARFLAPPEPRTLLMVGAGAMAPHLIAAHRAARPTLDRVLVWNRTAARARALVETLADPAVTVAEALEPAVRAADIVSAATMATTPLIAGAWLRPGAHLDLVGGYTPAMREADDDAVRRAAVFVDSRPFTVGQVGDLTRPMAAGVLAETDIRGDLFELATGAVPGRRDGAEITLFKNGGGSHLDLFTARFLLGRLS